MHNCQDMELNQGPRNLKPYSSYHSFLSKACLSFSSFLSLHSHCSLNLPGYNALIYKIFHVQFKNPLPSASANPVSYCHKDWLAALFFHSVQSEFLGVSRFRIGSRMPVELHFCSQHEVPQAALSRHSSVVSLRSFTGLT